MNEVSMNAVKSEIEKLIESGWINPPTIEENLHVARQVQEGEIKFPHEHYNTKIGNQEAFGVWAKWRARQILKEIKKHGHKVLWEVGSGHGNVAMLLQEEDIGVIGIEPLRNGAKITSKSGIRTYLGTLESLKLPPNSISAIGSFDVLEHLERPEVLLSEMYRVLKPGGLLLLTVPAHQWLFSDFDKSIGHYKRYSSEDLSDLLKKEGFQNVRTEFLFSIFVLPAFVLRKLPTLFGRNRNYVEIADSSVKQNKVLNAVYPILIIMLYLEKLLHLPFGLTLLSVSKKKHG